MEQDSPNGGLMPTTQQFLDHATQLLKQFPGWSDDQMVEILTTIYQVTPAKCRALLERARFIMDLETRRWLTSRRRPQPLPGDNNGFLDNAVRVLEEGERG